MPERQIATVEAMMKRLILALGALLLLLSASTPADATFAVVRWSNGWCSVWSDDNRGALPTEPGWRRVSRVYTSRDEAWKTKEFLWQKRKVCL
jgi:hypothetical protein